MPRVEEKVLLVDDEPRVLAGLQRRLSERFNILTAESGQEALDILARESGVAAAVADMRMPGMTGIELLQEMTRRWPEIRRLMLTGNTDQATAIAAANEGKVFRFFTKPCDTDHLAAALDDALEEYRTATQEQKDRQMLEVKAEAGEKARRAFLSTMSHELLTPLNHVLGFAAVLDQRLRERGENEELEYLDHIREGGETLLRMVRRVLEIARMSSDTEQRKRELLEVTAIIGDEIAKTRPEAVRRGISLSFHAGPQPLHIEASDYEFRLALAELLDNAIKFNKAGGHTGVALGSTADSVIIRITDTGAGIAGEDARRALSAFTGGESIDTTPSGGIGLGLTLAALFATAQGGKLGIEARPSGGTAVTLSLKRVVTKERLEAEQAAKIA
jgi:signal transduction histidine kinase